MQIGIGISQTFGGQQTQVQRAIALLRRTNSSPAGILDSNGYMQKPGNLLTWSHDFSAATWNRTGVTWSAGKLVESADTSGHTVANTAYVVPVAGAAYTAVFELKAAERGFALFGLNGGGTPAAFATVNLSTGAVSVATGSPTNLTVAQAADGYWLVTATITATTTASLPADIRISTDGLWANRVYAGTAGSGIYLRAAALLQGTYTAQQIQAMGGIQQTTTAAIAPTYTRAHAWDFSTFKEAYGPELVVNGDFALGTTGWSLQTGFVVSGQALQVNQASNTAGCYGYLGLPVGKTYVFKYSVSNYVSGTHRLQIIGNAVSMQNASGNGVFSDILYVNAFVAIAVQGNVTIGLNATIDNISVREVLSASPGLNLPNILFQDSAGTTPVTAVDQPIGLALDYCGGLGVNLVSNGGFDSLTGWTLIGAGGSRAIVSGELEITGSGGGYPGCSTASFNVTAGSTYLITVTGRRGSTASNCIVKLFSANQHVFSTTSNTTKSICAVAPSTASVYLQLLIDSATASGTAYFDNIVVQELTGIHASQITSSKKPTLRRGLVNKLLWSGDFTNAAWMKLSATAQTDLVAGLDGALSARRMVEVAENSYHQFSEVVNPAAGTYTAAASVKADGVRYLTVLPVNQGNTWPGSLNHSATFDLHGGVVTQVIGSTATATIAQDSNGFFVVAVTGTTVANSISGPTLKFSNSPLPGNFLSYMGSVTNGLIIHRAALYQGTVTAQQILDAGGIPLTTTVPASSAIGRIWAEFDGVDDCLTLSAVPFGMADDHAVVAGYRPDASTGVLFSAGSTASNNPVIAFDIDVGTARMFLRDDANTAVFATGSKLVRSLNITASARKVGSSEVLKVNGVVETTKAVALGASTFTGSALGGLVRSTMVNYFTGSIPFVAAIKSTLTDPELLLVERLAANRAGVQI